MVEGYFLSVGKGMTGMAKYRIINAMKHKLKCFPKTIKPS